MSAAPVVFATHAKVIGVEERRSPKKHIAYVVELEWSSGERTTVLRRFKDIYNFHVRRGNGWREDRREKKEGKDEVGRKKRSSRVANKGR